MLAHNEGLLLPKVRRQFAEFLQHPSLKRLGILYLPTCVGFGYGLYGGAISCNLFAASTNPIRSNNVHDPSHISRPTNINVVPIDYPLRARLRGRLTLRGLALRRNPWSFGERASHPLYRYSCQHSHFRYLHGSSRMPLHQLTERSATARIATNPELRCMALAPLHFRRKDPYLDQ